MPMFSRRLPMLSLWLPSLAPLTLVLLWLFSAQAHSAQVVVSIEPLAMLVEPFLGPGDRLTVLLGKNVSPHHYAMKASDMRALQSADLVLWVGPNLEPFLEKPLAHHGKALQLDQLAGLNWPEEEPASDLSHDDHRHAGRDPHVWLNPDNGATMMAAIAQKLILALPERQALIVEQRDQYIARIQGLTDRLATQLAPLQSIGFFVYHPAYGHWNQRFALRQIGAVSLTPEQKPGARHLHQLQNAAAGASCLMAESFYRSDDLEKMAKQLGLTLVLLDPLGTSIPEGEYRYEHLLENLATAMLTCLG